jgi:hypothetical protein
VNSPCLRAFRLPRGAPPPAPCIRQTLGPRTAGARQRRPLRFDLAWHLNAWCISNSAAEALRKRFTSVSQTLRLAIENPATWTNAPLVRSRFLEARRVRVWLTPPNCRLRNLAGLARNPSALQTVPACSYWEASREPRRPILKPTDLLPLIPAVNNGWTFAAFVVAVLIWLYLGRRGRGSP